MWRCLYLEKLLQKIEETLSFVKIFSPVFRFQNVILCVYFALEFDEK